MTYAIRTIVLLVSVVVLAGCQAKKQSAQISVGAYGLRSGQYSTSGGPTLNGMVTADASYQQDFQTLATYLVSSSIQDSQLGYVSSVGEGGTGVFIGGKVTLNQGNL